MPEFYPTYVPPHLTHPLSDYDTYAFPSQYVGHSEPPPPYASRHMNMPKDIPQHHPNPYGPYKGFGSQAAAGYGQHNNCRNSMNLPSRIDPPMVPPLRINDYALRHPYENDQRAHHQAHANQQREEEKVVGGVSAKLDYDMDQMTDFVVQMTIEVIEPPTYKLETFRSWVLQVLNATRLPSATILLSLSYMSMRIRSLVASRIFNPTEYSLYGHLTVALILGSKFLDDNTFQNKSWAEVSNIKVDILNKEELSWLAGFGHRLHHDPLCPDGFSYWESRWTRYQANLASAAASSVSLVPSENMGHLHSSLRNRTSTHYQPQYPVTAMSNISLDTEFVSGQFATPAYSPYNTWFHQRAGDDRSPSTASHTGPNTPDYYTGNAGWGPVDANSCRSRGYGYATVPNFSGFETYPPPPYETPSFNYPPSSVWNCHGATCQCPSCRQAHIPRYGPILVG